MATHSLLLLPGDGIGVETIAEVERLIAFLNAKSTSDTFKVERDLVGGAAYDKHGVAITDAAMAKAQAADAVIFGAVGGPSGTRWLTNTAPKQVCCACARISTCLPICAQPSVIPHSPTLRA